MTTKSVLNEAADLIEKRGHIKGTFFKTGGGFCAMGAIRHAAGMPSSPGWHERVAAARRAAASILFLPTDHLFDYGLSNWNDKPYRTKEEVVAVLRKAAAKES